MAPETSLIKLRHAFLSASEGMFYFFRLSSSPRLSVRTLASWGRAMISNGQLKNHGPAHEGETRIFGTKN